MKKDWNWIFFHLAGILGQNAVCNFRVSANTTTMFWVWQLNPVAGSSEISFIWITERFPDFGTYFENKLSVLVKSLAIGFFTPRFFFSKLKFISIVFLHYVVWNLVFAQATNSIYFPTSKKICKNFCLLKQRWISTANFSFSTDFVGGQMVLGGISYYSELWFE